MKLFGPSPGDYESKTAAESYTSYGHENIKVSLLDIYCRRINILHTKSSYMGLVGNTPLNMNTAGIAEST